MADCHVKIGDQRSRLYPGVSPALLHEEAMRNIRKSAPFLVVHGVSIDTVQVFPHDETSNSCHKMRISDPLEKLMKGHMRSYVAGRVDQPTEEARVGKVEIRRNSEPSEPEMNYTSRSTSRVPLHHTTRYPAHDRQISNGPSLFNSFQLSNGSISAPVPWRC